MGFLDEIIDLIDISIKDDAENTVTAGNIIKDGYSEHIDADRKIITQSHAWISNYQKKLIEDTGISNLKIKFTHNSGYFIEVSKLQIANIPDFFIQTQTLTQAARYKTQDLKYFEERLLSASQEMADKEYIVFNQIRNDILLHFNDLINLSKKIAYVDFCLNGATISLENAYTTPDISKSYDTSIIGGKHPVISQVDSDFISNDMCLHKKDFVHIITGPNMGGKSTYLRQNALLILMAHIGYDIPCKSSKIGLTDKIFSRVGSGDNLYLGQSTFMVEMQEVAYILRNSTNKSFVIIDEIGRGTSTYDGMSLAWSILRHNHDNIGSKTLFATHYHEIIDHAADLKGSSNHSVAVGENNDNIVFLRKIIPGGIKKSYGLEVARLAGIPQGVITEAQSMLQSFQVSQSFQQLTFVSESNEIAQRDDKVKESFDELSAYISELNINNITPIQGLEFISSLQHKLKILEKNLNNQK